LNVNALVKYGLATTPTVSGLLQPGSATDIGIGPTNDRDIWITGTDCGSGGCGIYHWNVETTHWEGSYGLAIAIDVGPQGPWVVNGQHNIFQWNGTAFTGVSGGAIDVGVGANGDVWVVGTNAANQGGNQIFKYNFAHSTPESHIGWQGSSLSQGAKRIDVAPDGSAWIVDSAGNIFHSTQNTSNWNPNTNAWSQVPGSASDVAVGADGSVYVVGKTAIDSFGNFQIYKYDGAHFNPLTSAGGTSVLSAGHTAVGSIDNLSNGQKAQVVIFAKSTGICNGQVMSLQSNPNCGACGVTCGASTVCAFGACCKPRTTCPVGACGPIDDNCGGTLCCGSPTTCCF
jgi:hypothetical protein